MTDETPRSDAAHGTPEGYTKEEPAVSEIGEPGSPGAGMTPAVPHSADADRVEHGHRAADPVADEQVAHHDGVTHMDAHTMLSDDDHGHAEATLGPIDWRAWGYAVAGAIGGLLTLLFFYFALTHALFT